MKHLVCMNGGDLVEGISLDAIGNAKLNVGDELLLQVNFEQEQKSNRVIQMADHGARSVIESECKQWWLRPSVVTHTGPEPCRTWSVGGLGHGD
ncbi:MAG: hypothetical protein U1E60_29640 [Reyranellaceae bacterium]